MYRGVDAVVINKIDLLPYVDFDMDYFRRGVEALNPGLVTFPLSCRTGEGLRATWIDWFWSSTAGASQAVTDPTERATATAVRADPYQRRRPGRGLPPLRLRPRAAAGPRRLGAQHLRRRRDRSRGAPTRWTPSSPGCRHEAPPAGRASIDVQVASTPSRTASTASRSCPRKRSPARFQSRSRPTWPSAPTACASCSTRPTAATATRSSTAPTAARASPSSPTSPTTGRTRRWPRSRCAPTAAGSTTTRPTAASTPSPSPARSAGRTRLASKTERRERLAERERGARRPPARMLARRRRSLAIKGLGGFHLACDADERRGGRRRLRRRKRRVDKPFAVMVPDAGGGRASTAMLDARRARAAARGDERPIVIAAQAPAGFSHLPEAWRPGRRHLGVMLPYTPLHHLAARRRRRAARQALVMTSGNLSEEPIAFEDDEARRAAGAARRRLPAARPRHPRPLRRLGGARRSQGESYPSRRSRGYAPFPVRLPWEVPPILAVGGELKNTFCLTSERYAFLSQHIGDLENLETLASFERGIAHFERLFRVAARRSSPATCTPTTWRRATPGAIAAAAKGCRWSQVQHHHAHIAACMAEHGLPPMRVIGVALRRHGLRRGRHDLGRRVPVGRLCASCERLAHLQPCRCPAAIRRLASPGAWRWPGCRPAGLPWDADLPPVQAAGAAAACHRAHAGDGLQLRRCSPDLQHGPPVRRRRLAGGRPSAGHLRSPGGHGARGGRRSATAGGRTPLRPAGQECSMPRLCLRRSSMTCMRVRLAAPSRPFSPWHGRRSSRCARRYGRRTGL